MYYGGCGNGDIIATGNCSAIECRAKAGAK